MPEGAARPLALLLGRLGSQAREGLLRLLPAGPRESALTVLENGLLPEPPHLEFAEQVLLQGLNRISRDEQAGKTFTEVVCLSPADLVAVVFLHASAEDAASVLPHLPQVLQHETLHRIAAQDWNAFARRVGRDEAEIVRVLDEAFGAPARKQDPSLAAGILRSLPSSQHVRRILSDVHAADPGAAIAIRDLLYGVEDLDRLSDREVQTLLRGADDWDLAIATGGLSSRLRGRIVSNVSERRARRLEEDEAHLSGASPEDVRRVQARLLARARDLYEAGRILTYLGSVKGGFAAEETEEEAQEEEEAPPAGPCASVRAELRREPVAGSLWRRGVVVAGAVVGVAVVGLWLSGMRPGRAGGRGGGLKATDQDFAATKSATRGAPPGASGGAGSARVQAPAPTAAGEGDVLVFSGQATEPDVSSLDRGDTLRAGTNPVVVRLWAGAGQVQADPGTELRLGDRADAPGAVPVLRLRAGHIWVYVRNPALEVHSPVASVTAPTGSLYRLRVVLSAATEVTVSRGGARVLPKGAAGGDLISLAPGETARIDPRGSAAVLRGGDAGERGWMGLF